ncbi:hypothetical protein BCV69DRAFT_283243 [Microstroma glucosiphilum]|uniref:Defects in morphology protein 1 n=1 Tax=Pseudomicrostroma glucosiphilum TaxID=1684307 RepID=A0A316U590_9BASI|nr:hypothetical protein BCV69DRAFT_283243 [Pseudomicrostroma glucosiphilum]PWN20370.1 hypothetical protein BCV69DRAFT_283243 [Pseudomicrostroma glucosiphilum]
MEKARADASGSDHHAVSPSLAAEERTAEAATEVALPPSSGTSASVSLEDHQRGHGPSSSHATGSAANLPPATATSTKEEKDIVSPTSSPAEASQRQRRPGTRRSHIAPSSLAAYVESKGYFSVTELVGPTWCEYSYQYGIFGLSFLPASQRPTEVALPSGAVLRPNFVLAEKKEEIQVAGREIHKKLEEEIHPEKVYVQTKSREDDWALRLLRLVVGLRALIDGGCVRELPVFGWVQDHLVMGIIDEIERRPLAPKKRKQQPPSVLDAEPPQDQPKLPFAPPTSPHKTSSTSTANPQTQIKSPSAGTGKKQWASQEEWKAHERKVSAAKKMAAKSKNKAKSRAGGPTASQSKSAAPATPEKSQKSPAKGTLMGFFGVTKGAVDLADSATVSESQGEVENLLEVDVAAPAAGLSPAEASSAPVPSQSMQSSQAVAAPSSQQPSRNPKVDRKVDAGPPDSPRFGYFLGDTKTRLFPAIPAIVDQRAARLQTMLYKRLLDGLCLGAMRRRAAHLGKEVADAARDPSEAERDVGLLLDTDATPVEFERLFSSLGLEARETLSDAFLEDAQVLLEGIEPPTGRKSTRGGREEPIDLTASQEILPGVQSLSDVAQLADKTLVELIYTARKQAGLSAETGPEEGTHYAAALQTSLSLIYRLQSKKGGRWKRNKKKRDPEETSKALPPSEKVGSSDTPQSLAGEAVRHQTSTLPFATQANGLAMHDADNDDEVQLMLAIQMSLDSQAEVRLSGAGAEDGEGKEGSQGSPPVATPIKTRGRGKRRSSASTVSGLSQASSSPFSQQPRRKSRRLAEARGEESSAVKTNGSQVNQTSANSPSLASTPTAPPKNSNGSSSKSNSDGKSTLIGTVHYTHSPRLLSLHLSSILGFWLQTRMPRGVKESETWKCNGCEWREGCEWRAERGEERWKDALASRSRREEEQMVMQMEHQREIGQLGEGEDAEEEEGDSSAEIIDLGVGNTDSVREEEEGPGDEDEDEDLWKHFNTTDDIGDELDIEEMDISMH